MPENKEKVTQYFSNVVVRTLRKDLEMIKQNGGMISYTPESIAKTNQDSTVKSREVEIVVPDITPQAATQTPGLSTTPAPARPASSPAPAPVQKKESSLGLIIALIGTVLILGGSVAYWVFLRPGPETPSPSPTAIVTETPLPSPVKQNPTISFGDNIKTSPMSVGDQPFAGALKAHLQQTEYSATTTLATISLIGPDQEYLTATAFIELISPDSLKSFRSTLGSNYALTVSVPTGQVPYLGAVLEIRTDGLITAQAIMKNWETANIEDYFKPLIEHHGEGLQTDQKFSAETVQKREFRTARFNSQNQGLIFSYGFIDNYLVISTHATLTKAIVQELAP